ncbi:unnamed protein product, partial [marine sediment metagenome]
GYAANDAINMDIITDEIVIIRLFRIYLLKFFSSHAST